MAMDNGMPGLLPNSTASCHMIADQSYFTKYCNIKGQHISMGGFNKLPVARMGSITFKANVPNGVNNVILHDVLHIPTLRANLISLGLLQQAGVSIRGLPFGICLAWEEQDFCHANLIGSNGTLY